MLGGWLEITVHCPAVGVKNLQYYCICLAPRFQHGGNSVGWYTQVVQLASCCTVLLHWHMHEWSSWPVVALCYCISTHLSGPAGQLLHCVTAMTHVSHPGGQLLHCVNALAHTSGPTGQLLHCILQGHMQVVQQAKCCIVSLQGHMQLVELANCCIVLLQWCTQVVQPARCCMFFVLMSFCVN